MTNKQLLKAIQELLDTITVNPPSQGNETDATEDFASTEVISKRNRLNALITQGNLFRTEDDDSEDSIPDKLFNEYNFNVTNEQFQLQYWWEINNIADKLFSLIKLNHVKFETNELALMRRAFRYAFLFGAVKIKGDKFYDLNGKELTFMSTNAQQAQQMASKQLKNNQEGYENEKDNEVVEEEEKEPENEQNDKKEDQNSPEPSSPNEEKVLSFWFDNIGQYVKLWPYLGKLIYLRRMKEKCESVLNLIPDVSRYGKAKVSWLYSWWKRIFRDRTHDNQNQGAAKSDLSDLVKWYTPPKEALDMIIQLNLQLERQQQLVDNLVGFPNQAKVASQALGSEIAAGMTTQQCLLNTILEGFELAGYQVEYQQTDVNVDGENDNTEGEDDDMFSKKNKGKKESKKQKGEMQ